MHLFVIVNYQFICGISNESEICRHFCTHYNKKYEKRLQASVKYHTHWKITSFVVHVDYRNLKATLCIDLKTKKTSSKLQFVNPLVFGCFFRHSYFLSWF